MANRNWQEVLMTFSLAITSASPCIGHCTTVLGDEVCRSCYRTFDEITRWVEMNDAERCAVNQRIATLKASPSTLPLSERAKLLP